MNEVRYPALRTISGYFRLLGWISVFVTGIVMVVGVIQVIFYQEFLGGGVFGFLGGLLGATFGSLVVLSIYSLIGFVIATINFATAEALVVFLDIENNTRK